MKWMSMLLALILLAGCDTVPLADMFPEWQVEWSTKEERDAWFEEQTALAETFLEESRNLLDEIAASIFETEVGMGFSELDVCPGYSADDIPHLDSFRRTSDKYRYSQGCSPINPELTLPDVSEDLDRLAKELCALHPSKISYRNNESGQRLEIAFADTEFPTAIFCSVYLYCEITSENPNEYTWTVKHDELWMFGL